MTPTAQVTSALPGPTYLMARKRTVRVPRRPVARKAVRYGTFLAGARLAGYLDVPRRDQVVLAAGLLSGLAVRGSASELRRQPAVVAAAGVRPTSRTAGAAPLLLVLAGAVAVRAAAEFAVFAVAEEAYERLLDLWNLGGGAEEA